MISYNAANERMKRQYFAYLAEAQGHSEQTIDAVAKAISRFEAFTRYKDFKAFHIEQAKAFKRDLADQRGHRSGEPLSKATLYATLTALKRFFIWLAGQPGYKSRISYSDAEYFNLSAKETRIAKATRTARVPTLEQIRHVIQSMPATTDIERRDRALIAFTILTGARDGAIASFKLRHIDIDQGQIDQDAREVRTKFSKSFVTTFFPVGDDIRAVVADWVAHLRTENGGKLPVGCPAWHDPAVVAGSDAEESPEVPVGASSIHWRQRPAGGKRRRARAAPRSRDDDFEAPPAEGGWNDTARKPLTR
jgi:site-specific recombinase XerD